jgi:hypothetical protein
MRKRDQSGDCGEINAEVFERSDFRDLAGPMVFFMVSPGIGE